MEGDRWPLHGHAPCGVTARADATPVASEGALRPQGDIDAPAVAPDWPRRARCQQSNSQAPSRRMPVMISGWIRMN